jgi:excisionase family DNA binding protein
VVRTKAVSSIATGMPREAYGPGAAHKTEQSDVLTLDEAAPFLRCHPKTLRLMAIRGEIPSRRVGSLWRFSKIVLESWMQQAA